MLTEGMRISMSPVKGFNEDVVLGWLREAAAHAQRVEAILMKNYRVNQAQIEGMWAYVDHKG